MSSSRGRWIDLHDLPPEALVHWDRDVAPALGDQTFQIRGEIQFDDVHDHDYHFLWDAVAWIPGYAIESSVQRYAWLHYPDGWILESQKSRVRVAWLVVRAITLLGRP